MSEEAIPSTIDYKDQGRNLSELCQQQPQGQGSSSCDLPSTLEYKDLGLTIDEWNANRRRQNHHGDASSKLVPGASTTTTTTTDNVPQIMVAATPITLTSQSGGQSIVILATMRRDSKLRLATIACFRSKPRNYRQHRYPLHC